MRIISGYLKSRRIQLPQNLHIRPTTDYAKESIFNIINNNFNFEDINVLDLFAGSGSVTIEFVSRGVKFVNAVEQNIKCFHFIIENLKQFDIQNAKASKCNVFIYLKSCKEQFDIIFADPPYDLPNMDKIPTQVFENKLLKNNGWLIIEHSKANSFKDHFAYIDGRDYGDTQFSILKYVETHD